MNYDNTPKPVRVIDVSDEPDRPAGRRPPRVVVHPLALVGWPASAGTPRLPRRRFVLHRRERAR
jgi:hypothetical protein